jgi:enolase
LIYGLPRKRRNNVKETIIRKVSYRTIFDSRGVETLEVDVETQNGFGRAAAPFGAPGSRGEFEAPAYSPEGIQGSIQLLTQNVIPALIGSDAAERRRIDQLLSEVDGTPNFERMGGNTSTVVSVACAKAAAESLRIPLFKFIDDRAIYSLPYPLGNVLGGGAHSLGPAPDMQEHLVVPLGIKSVKQGIRINLLVHEEVGRLLEKKDPAFAGGTDDENAWTANLNDFEAFQLLEEACKKISDQQGVELRIGLDLAADRLWDAKAKVYRYTREGATRTSQQQLDYLTELVNRFHMIWVEDGFHSNDYDSFAALNARVGSKCLVCADDIYATNPGRTAAGIKAKSAGAMIVKTNQVGTITGAETTSRLAQKHGVSPVLSHRSGETVDDSIAHLAVAWNALMIKTGVKGGERLAKLNALIRIEEEFGIKLIEWPSLAKFATVR